MSSIITLGLDNINQSFQLSDGNLVDCHIYDTAGQERYRALSRLYYNRADAALLVYDISERGSFENIKNYYIPQIKEKCKKDIIILLLGNKADKENERKVSIEEGVELASQEKYEFKETSCLQNKNVANAFEYLVERWNHPNQNEPTNQNQKEPTYRVKRSNTVYQNQRQINSKFKGDDKQKKINRHYSFVKSEEEQKSTKKIVLTVEKTVLPPKEKRKCC